MNLYTLMPTGIDLKGPWNKFIAMIPGNVLTILAVVGIVILIVGIGMWIWKARRGGDKKAGIILVILGTLLAGPKIIIPAILSFLQVIVDFFVTLITKGSALT